MRRLPEQEADAVLAAALDRAPFPYAIRAVSMLGDRTGPDGARALRRVLGLSGRGTANLRGIAALALAKRCGEDATAWLRDALHSAPADLEGYALTGLAGAGDDCAWDDVLARLPRLARRKVRSVPASAYVIAVAYLGRHLTSVERATNVVQSVRSDWPHLHGDDRAWFTQHWPDAAPSADIDPAGARRPDPAALQTWAREPLFRPAPDVWT